MAPVPGVQTVRQVVKRHLACTNLYNGSNHVADLAEQERARAHGDCDVAEPAEPAV